MDTINIIRLAISVAQRVRDIHTNQNLAALPKTANATMCTKPYQASWDNFNGCGWTCNSGYYKSGSSCLACTSTCTANTYETTSCTATQNRVCTPCTKPSNSAFPRLQDAAGVVILDITKVVIIALLALHVQQDSMNQEVVHPHKIVNVVYHAQLSATVNLAGKLMVMVVNCGDAKWAIIRMETRARNVHQNAKIMVQQEK